MAFKTLQNLLFLCVNNHRIVDFVVASLKQKYVLLSRKVIGQRHFRHQHRREESLQATHCSDSHVVNQGNTETAEQELVCAQSDT